MNIEIIIIGLASFYFIVSQHFIITRRGIIFTFLFNVIPTLLGIFLAVIAFGKFMGWPL